MSGERRSVPAFYLNQMVAVLIATLFLDGGRALGILLALLLLLNAAVYCFRLGSRWICLLPYLLLAIAVWIANGLLVG